VNRLTESTSPYLLQHASNPVDWYPWGDEAFATARERDVPVFLSIGYAACHWCHVMERESFEDERLAAYLNDRFVSIKVDREERPDVDATYMDAALAMTGSGGWPLSVFVTADREPFYVGTYFPPVPRGGLPSFHDVLEAITQAWNDRRGELTDQAGRLAAAIRQRGSSLPAGATASVDADAAMDALHGAFDPRWGGFGGAPKFPQPMTLEWLLRRAVRGSGRALTMATTTLDGMSRGGIYDLVGGGFARYSTDERWHVPHFEKMLSDNAQLAQVYARAWVVTRDPVYRAVALATAEFLCAELLQPGGGFASSLDADVDGLEGAFYVWNWQELVNTVGEAAARSLGGRPDGNWGSTNVLWSPQEPGVDTLRPAVDLDDERNRLRAARAGRARPATDDKIVTAWNGLAIRALCETGRIFGMAEHIDAAERCAAFIWTALRSGERLQRSWRAGTASVPGFLDDHTLLGSACLALFETTGNATWLERAHRLLRDTFELFGSVEDDSLFLTGNDVSTPVGRRHDVEDQVTPSGNASAAELSARLALILGEPELTERATRLVASVGDLPARFPTGFGHTLCVLDLLEGPTREVAIVGSTDDGRTTALIETVVRDAYRPNVVLAIGPPDGPPTAVPLLHDRGLRDENPTAYVCSGFVCQQPVTEPADLAAQLDAVRATE
jgi:uncharacterized protein YyaL (SSP411 family)